MLGHCLTTRPILYAPACCSQENAQTRLAKFIEILGEDQCPLKVWNTHISDRARRVSQGSFVSMG